AGRVMLKVFHYASPVIVVLFFLAAQSATFCSIRKDGAREQVRKQKLAALLLMLLTLLLYVAEAVSYIFRALVEPGWWASQDLVLYTLESVVVWGIIGITFLDSADPVYSPYLGSSFIGAILEAITGSLTVSYTLANSTFDTAVLVLKLSRVVLLTTLSIGFACVLLCNTLYGANEECQALLKGSAEDSDANASKAGYGTLSENPTESSSQNNTDTNKKNDGSNDEDEDDKDIKEKQRKRLEEHGGWWGYLKGFTVFLPILSPVGDRKMQICYAVMSLFMLWQRFENVLLPNQLGVITRRLAEVHGTGVLPWKEVGIWILLRWIPSGSGLGIIQNLVKSRIQNFSMVRIARFAFNHVMSLSMDFHNDKSSGEVLKAVDQGYAMNDIIESFVFTIGPIVVDMVIGMVFVTYLFDLYLAFIVFVTGLLYLWVTIRLRKTILSTRRAYIKKYREKYDVETQAISDWLTVSYFNRGRWECDRFDKALEDSVTAELAYFDRHYLNTAVTSLILVVGHMCSSYLAVYRVSQGSSDVGTFVTFVTYWGTLIGPLSRLASEYKRMSQNLVDAERLLQLIKTKPSVTTKPGAPDLRIDGGEVCFKDVSFSYDDRKEVLLDINFTAKPGQTVAFVGETGGGKSTMLKLLFRHYDVTGGSITIDGQDIRDITLDSLRDTFGMVPQDPSMFNRTIIENVRYARLDATDDDVKEACKAAAIHDKIESFPDKYNSKVGEHGIKLSGGERQRVAIARVILKNPHIVLLDEATSAVDSSTEEAIQDAFRKLSRSRTTFVIAHRLSTIVEADMILVVENGKIVEQGSHDELLTQDGKYTELWRKQTKTHTKSGES
ncbi:putative ABC transporter, partial [Rhizodiscina lignyota]